MSRLRDDAFIVCEVLGHVGEVRQMVKKSGQVVQGLSTGNTQHSRYKFYVLNFDKIKISITIFLSSSGFSHTTEGPMATTIFVLVYVSNSQTLVSDEPAWTDEGAANKRRDDYNADVGAAATRYVAVKPLPLV